MNLFNPQFGYGSWEISEWLINYEGGFVRRGIVGQILLAFEHVEIYDVRIAIRLLYVLLSVVMLLILYRVFKSEGWSPLLLPTGLCVGYTLFNLWGRKDFLMLALTLAIFYCYRSAITRSSKRMLSWLLLYVLSTLLLLIHEASFFFTFPILLLCSYGQFRASNLSRSRSALLSLLQFLPVLVVMAVVCLFKGDKSVADAIWASWDKVFATYPAPGNASQIGASVQAIGWESVSSFGRHFYNAYVGCVNPSPWGVPLALLVMLSAYYLLTRINTVTMGRFMPKRVDHTLLSNVALVQFISLLPMFTVLSCDWGRTLPYWVLSSLFFYHVFHCEAVVFPSVLTRISRTVQNFISGNRLLRSPYTYLLLVLLTPVPNYYAPLDHINTIQQRHCLYIHDLINQIAALFS